MLNVKQAGNHQSSQCFIHECHTLAALRSFFEVRRLVKNRSNYVLGVVLFLG